MISVKQWADELEKENIKLVAGRNHLDREITYVTSLELTERTSRIKEKGFVMSTFHAFKDSKQIVNHIQWLAQIGISALGFHTASIKTIPEEVIKCANVHSLPLFEIPEEIPYYLIIEKFNQLFNEKENKRMTEINKLNEKLMEFVLLEKDLNSIVKVIGKHIHNTVLVLDPYFEPMAFWIKKEQSRSEIKGLMELIINQHKENILKVRFTNRETTISIKQEMAAPKYYKVFPLFSKLDFLGYMLICQEGIRDQFSEEIIHNGIRALCLAAHSKNTLKNYQKRKDIQLFERIFQGETKDIRPSDYFININKVRCIFQVQSVSPENLQTQFQMFTEVFKEYNSNSFLWIYDRKLVGVIETIFEKEKISTILNEFPQIRIGISAIENNVDTYKIKNMYDQSSYALIHSLVQNEQLVFWDQIGIEKIAYQLSANPLFHQIDEEILGPILSFDREKNASLTDTLYVYLKHFFNLQKSSSELYVHPNTVKYRVQKINELLDFDIQNPSHYSMIMLAFSLHHFKQKNRT